MNKTYARWLGGKIKSAFKTNRIADILLDAEPIHAGALDGGCLVLAKALKRIEPDGKIITVEGELGDGTWQAEHYGYSLYGAVIDGNGYSKSVQEWADRFAEKENLTKPYRVKGKLVASEDIPDDPATEKRLACALLMFLCNAQ